MSTLIIFQQMQLDFDSQFPNKNSLLNNWSIIRPVIVDIIKKESNEITFPDGEKLQSLTSLSSKNVGV